MPLTNVRDLVSHADRHGYMVASFKVHGAEEIQAVVAAAADGRAPVILAIDTPGPALLDHEIVIGVAESVAARADVPVAIETVSDVDRRETTAAGRSEDADSDDLEIFLPPEMTSAEMGPAPSWASADRIGIAMFHDDRSALRVGALRKHLQAITDRFDGAVVIDGDLAWSESSFRTLPGLGVAKVNFDRRLRQAMATANRKAAKNVKDDYRRATEYVVAALMREVSACLRRTGCTGRAADVMACTSLEPQNNADDDRVPDYRLAQRYHYGGIARSADAMMRRRSTEYAERPLQVQ